MLYATFKIKKIHTYDEFEKVASRTIFFLICVIFPDHQENDSVFKRGKEVRNEFFYDRYFEIF